MTKHRLELFSDGVFAIILTLLVLDLRVPESHGTSSFLEIVPALLVHAASFLVVASLWMAHHGVLARVTGISTTTLRLNLLCLFWATLIPFGAKNAAERPLEPLGACLIAATTGLCVLSMGAMRRSAHSTVDDDPLFLVHRRKQFARVVALCLADLVCAGLVWLTPWPAYGVTLATALFLLLGTYPADVDQRAGRQAV